MRSRRVVIFGLVGWVVVLFVVGGVWRAFHPEQPPRPDTQLRFIESRQHGYDLCLALPQDALERRDVEARKRLLANRLPNDDQTATLRGCYLAVRR
jgi:hypothetical protein